MTELCKRYYGTYRRDTLNYINEGKSQTTEAKPVQIKQKINYKFKLLF